MKKTKLICLILAAATSFPAAAAGLERAWQSTEYILDDGNRIQIGTSFVSPKLKGKALNLASVPTGNLQYSRSTGDVADHFFGPFISGKFKINDSFSIGMKYEQPFGVKVNYPASDPLSPTPTDGMSADALVHNFTVLLAYHAPGNFTVFAGPQYQRLKADVKLMTPVSHPVTGTSLGMFPYHLNLPNKGDWGYVVGAAWKKPEIGLKAALTYRSSIKYKHTVNETISGLPPALGTRSAETSFKVPQSLNLEFQTGIAPDTLLLASVRWVDWSSFRIHPSLAGELIAYPKDSMDYNLGIGRKLTEKLSGSVFVSHDTGTGQPSSPLGPNNKSYSVGFGVKYYVNKNLDITAGMRYRHYKDNETKMRNSPLAVGKFDGMNFFGAAVQLGYSF